MANGQHEVTQPPLSLLLTFYQTTLRIRFPDQTQLEKVFQSTEKIRSVYAFVRSCLREDVKPVKFILCMPTRPLQNHVCVVTMCSLLAFRPIPPKERLQSFGPQRSRSYARRASTGPILYTFA
jgi:hypothetical protein